MRKLLLVVAFALVASPASAQDCTPTSLRPGPAFVPTADCLGWVTVSHPLARKAVTPAPVELGLTQDVFVRIDSPRANASGAVTSISGWALDCSLGSLPPEMRIVETKPDGSTREVPNDFFPNLGSARPDVQNAYAGQCPAVLNAPDSFGNSLGPNDRFGWSIALRSPITERGVHTFTAIFSWPSKGHSGSTSVSVNIQ
jgi:hypothetical protein